MFGLFKKNEFKFSTLRQFGSENVSFTSTIYSGRKTLTGKEIERQVAQIGYLIKQAFLGVTEREISEKDILIATSERRNEAIAKHDAALKAEMAIASQAKETMKQAERESARITKHK